MKNYWLNIPPSLYRCACRTFCYCLILFVLANFPVRAQDAVKFNSKFLKVKSAQWGLEEIDSKRLTLAGVSVNTYYFFGSKDKNAEHKTYFSSNGKQLEMTGGLVADSAKAKVAVGFYGTKLMKSAHCKVYQGDNLCALTVLFEDMAFGGNNSIWQPGSAKNLKLYLYKVQDIVALDSSAKAIDSEFLYLLQNTTIKKVTNPNLGKPLDSLELMRNGIMVKFLDPLKFDLQYSAFQKLSDMGFKLDEKRRPDIAYGNKSLWMDKSWVEIEADKFYSSPAKVGNMPILKASQVPADWLKDDLFKEAKEQRFELRKLGLPTYAPLDKSNLVRIQSSVDSTLQASVSHVLKESDIDLQLNKSRFYVDSTLRGLYVTGLINEKHKPEYLFLPFFPTTYFVDMKPTGFVDDGITRLLLDSMQVTTHGVPVKIDQNELLFEAPLVFGMESNFTATLTGFKDLVDIHLEQTSATNIEIRYGPKQGSEIKGDQALAVDTVEHEKTTVFYLDIAELNNKRLLQFYLQEHLDTLAQHRSNYLLFLSNGSNPLVDSSQKGGYMEIIKKISFLYPETASPRSDKSKLVEALIREEVPVDNLDFYFFLSPVSYNRFKDYMINEIKVQYNADVTIIVESMDNQRIDEQYKHIELKEKK